jgi:hypothetical protein
MKIRQPRRGRTAIASFNTFRHYPIRSMEAAIGLRLGPLGRKLRRK